MNSCSDMLQRYDSALHFPFLSHPGTFLNLSLPLSPYYCHCRKSPGCNRNRALSCLIRCFPFSSHPPFPSRFYHVWRFYCAPLLCSLGFWMSPLKVIWFPCLSRLCTCRSHIVSLSLVIKREKKKDLLAGSPPTHPLRSNPQTGEK